MPRTIDAPPSQVHWAKKYAAEISVALGLFSIFFIILAIYLAVDKPSQPATVTPQPVPQATPLAPPAQAHKSNQTHSVVRAAAIINAPAPTPTPPQQRIIEQPQYRDLVFSLSSHANLQEILNISVVKIRTGNGNTALSLKIDGSMNTRTDVNIFCPTSDSDFGRSLNIVDNHGRRYRFLGTTLVFPERLACENGGPYNLAPHEVVYQTYLFDQFDENISSFDVNFHPSNQQPFSIHVVI